MSQSPSSIEQLKESVVRHYESTLGQYGPTARGMDWKDETSQRLRFRMLCDGFNLAGLSIHDVGCGAGHLYDYLNESDLKCEYSGSDRSRAMIDSAQKRLPGIAFDRRDWLEDSNLPTYDVLVCSGLFHVKVDNDDELWRQFVERMIARMYEHCRVGIAFNLMSDQVDWRSDTLYYADPAQILDHCRKNLSRHVALRHDYPLYEFTVHVYRDSQDA